MLVVGSIPRLRREEVFLNCYGPGKLLGLQWKAEKLWRPWTLGFECRFELKESGPYIAFSATKGTPTTTSIQIEKDTWPFVPLSTICLVPRPWPFAEWTRPTISLGTQGNPDVTHIDGRAYENGVPTYSTALMALESPGVE